MKDLFIDRIKDRTKVLGPGVRAAVWFHGCRRNCPGCIAAEMNAGGEFDSCGPLDLVERIGSVGGVEGVTVSGGEPFDQDPESLYAFLRGVRSRGLSVMAYTGYAREELEADAGMSRALGCVDILVDGPYVEGEDRGELWRGSANQRLHFLTDRYRDLQDGLLSAKGRPVEVEFDRAGGFSFAGIPPRGFRERLAAALERRGLEVEW